MIYQVLVDRVCICACFQAAPNAGHSRCPCSYGAMPVSIFFISNGLASMACSSNCIFRLVKAVKHDRSIRYSRNIQLDRCAIQIWLASSLARQSTSPWSAHPSTPGVLLEWRDVHSREWRGSWSCRPRPASVNQLISTEQEIIARGKLLLKTPRCTENVYTLKHI